MSESFLRTQGIILRAFPFRDYDQLLALFTVDAGIIKVICHGSRSQRSKWRGLCIPLTTVELVYREKKGDIVSLHDMALVDAHEQLRQDYTRMEAACDVLNALYSSQLLGKTAPELYALMDAYLKRMPAVDDPWILAHSFRLKLLRHDGLLHYPFVCSHCEQELWTGAYFGPSEIYCGEHQVPGVMCVQEEELHLMYHLGIIKSFRELVAVAVPVGFRLKVEHLFRLAIG